MIIQVNFEVPNDEYCFKFKDAHFTCPQYRIRDYDCSVFGTLQSDQDGMKKCDSCRDAGYP